MVRREMTLNGQPAGLPSFVTATAIVDVERVRDTYRWNRKRGKTRNEARRDVFCIFFIPWRVK